MGLSKDKLETFKKLLLTRREALSSGLVQKNNDLAKDETFFADAVDQAAHEVDKNLAVAMKNRDQGTLTQIDQAIRRIDSGTFGDCDRCGESITEARLKAFPLTTLCIDCKAELESDQGRTPGRL